MSLMSKLSAILISISLFAGMAHADANVASGGEDQKVIDYLKSMIGSNPVVSSIDVSIVNKIPVEEPAGWQAYVIMLDGKVKSKEGEQAVRQQQIYFVNGDIITPELHNIRLKRRVNELVSPAFDEAFYLERNRLSGNADAAHKVVIFSDPLCPFCRQFVPSAIEEMKTAPETYAVYYFHLPLATLHPAAVTLVKAAIAAEAQGRKNVVLDLYRVEINPRETNPQVILDAFNQAMGTKITLQQIEEPAVLRHYEEDQQVAMRMMVNGTPTVFFDGKKDPSKKKYKEFKGNK